MPDKEINKNYKITQIYCNAGKEEEDGTAAGFCYNGRI